MQAKANTGRSPGMWRALLPREQWDNLEVNTTTCFSSWFQSPPTLSSSEVSRTDFGALGYKWRIPGEADRIRYKIAKNLWCRLKANPFQPQPFCEIFYTGSFGDLSNSPPRGTWKAGWKYQSCIPEVNITIPLGTYTPRPADISASLISRVST